MTLEQIETNLPNGLHDALIRSIAHNYETSTVDMAIDVLWGLPDDPPDAEGGWRPANLRFTEVLLFTIQAPENERTVGTSGSIWFTYHRAQESDLPPKLTDRFPPDSLAYMLYVLDWESCIHIVARDVNLEWPDDAG